MLTWSLVGEEYEIAILGVLRVGARNQMSITSSLWGHKETKRSFLLSSVLQKMVEKGLIVLRMEKEAFGNGYEAYSLTQEGKHQIQRVLELNNVRRGYDYYTNESRISEDMKSIRSRVQRREKILDEIYPKK